jgi:hypothetical protein
VVTGIGAIGEIVATEDLNGYLSDSGEDFLKGNWTDKNTALGKFGFFTLSALYAPSLVAACGRDFAKNVIHWEYTNEHYIDTALNALGIMGGAAAAIKALKNLKGAKAISGNTNKTVSKKFNAPSGGEITAKVKGDVAVPIGKVEKYMRGNVPNPKQELKELNAFQQKNRKLFDANPNNTNRLETLVKLNDNYKRSIDMASKLESIGLKNTKESNDKIFNLLFDAGNKAMVDNRFIKTIIEGPNGMLKMESIWKILPDGTKYLSTVKLIPIS